MGRAVSTERRTVQDPLCTHVVGTLTDTWQSISDVCAGLDDGRGSHRPTCPVGGCRTSSPTWSAPSASSQGLEPAAASGRTFATRAQPDRRAQRERGRSARATPRRRRARRVGRPAASGVSRRSPVRRLRTSPTDAHPRRAGHDGRLPGHSHPRLLASRAGCSPRTATARQPRRPSRPSHDRPAASTPSRSSSASAPAAPRVAR